MAYLEGGATSTTVALDVEGGNILTSGRYPTRAWRAASLASTRGRGGGSARVTEVSSRGECVEDVWLTSISVVPLP